MRVRRAADVESGKAQFIGRRLNDELASTGSDIDHGVHPVIVRAAGSKFLGGDSELNGLQKRART
jgi:hypothetical protein